MTENKNKDVEVTKTPSEKETIISEMHELNVQYKTLIGKKQQLGAEMQKLDEEILKKVGAFQAFKKLLEKLEPPSKKEIKEPLKKEDNKKE